MTRGARRAPVVVVGLDCITGLQTTRIFRGRGIPVIGVAGNVRHFACRTRTVDRIVQSELQGPALLDTLDRLAGTWDGRAVLVPCTDASVYAVSEGRERLDRYHVLLPSHDTVHTLMDKHAFQAFAERHDIPVPRTRTVVSRAEAARVADELTFPLVVKPPIKTPEWQARTSAKAFEVESPAALLALYDRVAGWAEALILQEWIVGGEDALYSFNGYYDRSGEARATFIARKLRQWPPRTGTSASGAECRDDEVMRIADGLFRAAGYHGLGYVEIKKDARSGRYVVIEPNVGRPTGRSAIAEAGGVELLMTAYADAVGAPLPAHRTQAYGNARWVYLRHDLQAATRQWRRGEGNPIRWLLSLRGRRAWAVWSWTDPSPFLWDLIGTARKALARVRLPVRRLSQGRALRPVD